MEYSDSSSAEPAGSITRFVFWLEEIDRRALGTAGGKGANLGEMARAGLPVPPGFVVAAEAYRLHLAEAALESRIGNRLLALPVDDLAALEGASAEIQEWILAAPMPEQVAAAVAGAYRQLATRVPGRGSEPAVAVRSSATAEDLPEASFAGQHETCLNVTGQVALLEAVRRCWASLWAPRALAYRARMGYDHLAVRLAVVVQAMVPADVAGVMFTANPVTGAADEFLVTASYGLGETVVSGLVTPDTYVLTAEGTVSRTLGMKEQRAVPAAGETRTEAVRPDDRSRYCLTDADLAGLADLGRRLTAHYGAPQDIEWTLAGRKLYLLQSRPITALAGTRPGGAAEVGGWDGILAQRLLKGLGDHFSEPLKPLDFAVLRVVIDGLLAVFQEIGLRPAPAASFITELPDGRIAFRPSLPGLSLRVFYCLPKRLIRAIGEDPGLAWAPVAREFERSRRALCKIDPRTLDPEGLVELILGILAVCERYLPERFRRVFPPGILHDALLKFWVRRARRKAKARALTRQLFLALPYFTARMNRDVFRLAQLAAAQGKRSPAFEAALNDILREWGNRPVRGTVSVPSVPNWREEPAAVLGLVDALLAAGQTPETESLEARQRAEFEAARKAVTQRLGRVGRRWFGASLHRARSYLMAREDGFYIFERVIAQMRRAALELGARWTAAGVLAETDDIFFLREEELRPVARGELTNVRERVERRRRGFNKVAAACARGENWLVASGSIPATREPLPADVALGRRLTGLAASPGRAAGRVCVIRSPAEFSKLKKGDILVAPATVPAWTPLFGVAAAVVTDVGGPLSHAAIVAREYGIPAVLGVNGATNLLRDGQRVTVDGGAGWVSTERQ